MVNPFKHSGVVDPREVVKNGWVKLSSYSKIQQSGIDISVNKIEQLIGPRDLKNPHTMVKKLVTPSLWLKENTAYDFTCHEYVEVPKDCIAIIFVRSTYNRRGAFVTTGLYDNGFRGYIQGMLRTNCPVYLPKNERIAQIVFIRCNHVAQYDGQYQDRKEK